MRGPLISRCGCGCEKGPQIWAQEVAQRPQIGFLAPHSHPNIMRLTPEPQDCTLLRVYSS